MVSKVLMVLEFSEKIPSGLNDEKKIDALQTDFEYSSLLTRNYMYQGRR